MATECTQESVLDFLLENGGRVKNKDLIDHFKVFLSSENTKRTLLKERFKRFVDNIAYVKQENGEKVVCLKKKYRYPEMRRAQGEDRDDDDGGGAGDEAQNRSSRVAENRDTTGIKRGINSLQLEENGVKPACDTSQWIKGEINGKHQTSEMLIDGKSEAVNNEKKMFVPESETHNAEVCLTDIALIEKNNSEISNVRENMLQDTRNVSEHDIQSNVFELDQTVHAAELSNVHSAGKLESRASEVELDAGVGKSSLTSQIISRRRTSRGSQRSLLASSEDGSNEGLFDLLNSDGSTPKGSRKNFIELMMSSSPQVRRTLVHRNSQGNMSARNRDSLRSESDSNIILSSMDEDCASVTLDPLEHEWMICAADGQWESLQRLLTCEPSLISKKDFVTGFTCLHWAAKQGKHELFAMLVNFAKQHNVPININARSSAGYTPLHLAAMHNHIEVMKLLVGAYDADVDMRDYSGKKASQYLSATVTGDIKDIIGACRSSDTENAETGAGRWRLPKVLPSNLNPLRLLNHPEETAADGQVKPRSLYRKSSIGRIKLQRNRFKTQIVHSTSFRENDEGDNSLKSPVKSRPVSNLFG